MSEAPEKIITDEEIAYVHANANFGSMSPRDVVSDGVRKYAVGYTGGSTQVAILREHGLITATKGCGYKANLTEKGKRYARAIYSRADLPPTPEQIKADPRVQALVVAQDRIDSLSAQLTECEARLLKVTAEREEENIKFQMANTAWDQETATRKVAEAQAATIKALVEAWIEVAIYCSITDGVCCCGDNMEGHADPMNCGHTPTDHGAYYAHRLVKSTEAALAAFTKEPKT